METTCMLRKITIIVNYYSSGECAGECYEVKDGIIFLKMLNYTQSEKLDKYVEGSNYEKEKGLYKYFIIV